MRNSSFNNFLSDGKLNIFNEDALDFLPKLENESIDLIYCDLPFGTTKCSWDEVIPFDKMWEQVIRIAKQNAPIIFHAQQPFTSALIMSNPKMFKYEWIWEKDRPSNPLVANKRVMPRHENICVFYEKQPIYNPQKEERKEENKRNNKKDTAHETGTKGLVVLSRSDGNTDFVHPTSIQKFTYGEGRGQHPTQKPVALFEYLLKTYSNEGMTIFDPCMGSGTTNLACLKLNRKSIGIEKEKQYYDVAVRRLSSYCG